MSSARGRIPPRRIPGSSRCSSARSARGASLRSTGTESRRATLRTWPMWSDGVLRACHAPGVSGEVINVATAGRTSINQLFRTVRDLVGARVEPIYAAARQGDVRDSQADIQKARRLLGYEFDCRLRRRLEEDRRLVPRLPSDRRLAAKSLVGWTLRDSERREVALEGSVAAGQSQAFRRKGQATSNPRRLPGHDHLVGASSPPPAAGFDRLRPGKAAARSGRTVRRLHGSPFSMVTALRSWRARRAARAAARRPTGDRQ